MGMVEDVILYVVYTDRDGIWRIISARRANRRERKNTVRYSLNNLPEDTQTNWKRVKNMTESEIEASAVSDVGAQPTDAAFWTDAEVVMPQPKRAISLRVDSDVNGSNKSGHGCKWFKQIWAWLSDAYERSVAGVYGSPTALGFTFIRFSSPQVLLAVQSIMKTINAVDT